MRYAGQNFELSIPAGDPAALQARFEAEHERMYGYTAPEEPIQLVTFRVEATGRVPKSEIRPVSAGGRTGSPVPSGHRDVWIADAGGWSKTALYDRASLSPGDQIDGPAIVEQMDSTTLILPGQRAVTDAYANIIIEEVS